MCQNASNVPYIESNVETGLEMIRMMKNKYAEFTESLFNRRSGNRFFMIYYRYDGSERSYPLAVNKKTGINLDPRKKIERISEAPLQLYCYELGPWLRLMDKFIRNDPSLKIMVVDYFEVRNERIVMAVGKNGQWNIREHYMPAIRKVLVGDLHNVMVS